MSTINVEHNINIHLENKGISRKFFIYLFIMYALVYMTKNCFSSALADIVSSGILTKSQTGLITAMFYIVYTPLQVVGGIIADKFSPEKMIKIGLVGSAIANAVIFFNHSYYLMLVVWTLNAVVQFSLWPSTYKIVSSQLCRSDRSYMIFFISLASSFGLVVSYVVAAFMPSWEYNFALSAVVLFGLAVVLHIFDRTLNRYMKPDYEPIRPSGGEKKSVSTVSLFARSGFFLMLIAVLCYTVVNQGARSLFPVMLVETFGKSASFGNLLNVLIIVSGICGTLLLKLVLYPKVIKNEVLGMIIFAVASLGSNLILVFASGLSVMVVSLCAVSLTTTVVSLLNSYFNSSFTKFGKNGTAAGISNAAASLAFAISSYGVVKVAEVYDWQTVKVLWLALAAATVLLLLIILPLFTRFKKTSNSI
jgi:sugar phosphate permease